MKERYLWIVLLLAALFPVAKPLFSGEAIGPWDHIRPMMGIEAPPPETAWDVLQADACLQFYPWRDLVFESWSKLKPPYYNPHQMAGVPLLANSQSGGFYPPHGLMGVLRVPTPLAMAILAWLHLFWAGFGIFHLSKRMGACSAGALMAGVSFALSPFMIGWTGLASVITTVCWIPWVLCFCLGGVLSARGPGGGLSVRAPLIALCMAMMILGGHLQFVAFGALAAIIIIIGTHGREWKGIALSFVGMGLGACLAAPQLMPVLDYAKHSHRKNAPTEDGFAAYQASAIQPYEFGNLVYPRTLGNPRELQGNTGVSNYWPTLTKRGANATESAVSPGPIVLVCLCLLPLIWRKFASKEGPAIWPMALVGLLGLAVAAGTPINRLFYFFVPGWSATGSPGRAIVLFLIAAPVLAALAVRHTRFERTAEGPPTAPYPLRAMQVTVLAFGLLCFGLFSLAQSGATGPLPGIAEGIYRVMIATAGPGALSMAILYAFVATLPIVATYSATRIRRTDPTLLFPAAALFFGVLAGGVRSGAAPPPQTPDPNKRVAFMNQNWDLLASYPARFPGNTSSIVRQFEVAGYDSLLHIQVHEWLKELNGEDPSPAANGNLMFVKPNALEDKLEEAGVSEVTAPHGLPQMNADGELEPPQTPPTKLLGGMRASVNGELATIESQTLSSVTVKVPRAGTLTLRDHNLGGWTATQNGKNLALEPGRWLTVQAEAGLVEFRYTPPGLKLGLGLFAVALAVLAIWVLKARNLIRAAASG